MPSAAQTWDLRNSSLDLTQGVVVGILNVTPDSFSDGGQYVDPDVAVAHGLKMWAQGAALIDVGGESTRPGSKPVPAQVELERVVPVVTALAQQGVRVSVDTSKPEVARDALAHGAEAINDHTGLANTELLELVVETACGVVVMHMKGTPADMQLEPSYEDVVGDVVGFLAQRTSVAVDAGLAPGRICLDPGIGFGKNLAHNLRLLTSLGEITDLGYPLMLGTSRKRFLATITGEDSLTARDQATAITTALGFASGARVFRVHNVEASRRALAAVAANVAPLRWDEWLLDSNLGASHG